MFVFFMWLEKRFFHTERMRTSESLDINLRTCPKPKDSECPPILHIPKGSEVIVYHDVAYHDQTDGRRATWRKVEYMQRKGWVNESLLRK